MNPVAVEGQCCPVCPKGKFIFSNTVLCHTPKTWLKINFFVYNVGRADCQINNVGSIAGTCLRPPPKRGPTIIKKIQGAKCFKGGLGTCPPVEFRKLR